MPFSPHSRIMNTFIISNSMKTDLGVDFGLAAAAVVVVSAGIGIFMNSVQKPEEKLQGIVLRVSPKLRGVFGHYALRRRGRRGRTSQLITLGE